MKDGKPAPSLDTPFERVADFTRRIVAVPHSEVKRKMRALERRKKRAPKAGRP